jgi:hypothetical protein
LDDLFTGTDVEMVGVAEDDLCADIAEIPRRERPHRALCADRHEHGRVDGSVRQLERAGARLLQDRVNRKRKRVHAITIASP